MVNFRTEKRRIITGLCKKNVIFQLKKGKETKSRKRYDNHVNKKDACIMNLSIYKGMKGNKYE